MEKEHQPPLHEQEEKVVADILRPGNLVWGATSLSVQKIQSIFEGIKPSKFLHQRLLVQLRPDDITCAILPHPIWPDQTHASRLRATGAYGVESRESMTIIIDRQMVQTCEGLIHRVIANGTHFRNQTTPALGALDKYRDLAGNTTNPGDNTIFGFPIRPNEGTQKPHSNEVSFYYPEPTLNGTNTIFLTPELWCGIVAYPEKLDLCQSIAQEMGISLPPFLTYRGTGLNTLIAPYIPK